MALNTQTKGVVRILNLRNLTRLMPAFALFLLGVPASHALTAVSKKKAPAKRSASLRRQHVASAASSRVKANYFRPPAKVNPAEGDLAEGEDQEVRAAAVAALGNRNGTVVVTDASTGRVLTIVNQKMALKSGFTPCSTIKIPVALAALTESLVDPNTPIRLSRQTRATMAMTEAIAISNNDYFARLGEKLGFDRVSYYAKLYGLGEKATLDLETEQPGTIEAVPPKWGGVGMMTSFGLGFTLTPLEYAAIMGAVANGGTLYYLQYPRTAHDAEMLVPRIKRSLDLSDQIAAIRPGMMGAVEHGTAKLAGFDPNEPVYGKTGTCTDSTTYQHLGWFGSFSQKGERKLAVVVLLAGSHAYTGPVASGVGGQIYKTLEAEGYFNKLQPISPVAMIGH